MHHPLHADRQVIKDVDFHVRRGEVVGIAGLMGAGRTEFAMSLFGRSWGRKITGRVLLRRPRGRPVERQPRRSTPALPMSPKTASSSA